MSYRCTVPTTSTPKEDTRSVQGHLPTHCRTPLLTGMSLTHTHTSRRTAVGCPDGALHHISSSTLLPVCMARQTALIDSPVYHTCSYPDTDGGHDHPPTTTHPFNISSQRPHIHRGQSSHSCGYSMQREGQEVMSTVICSGYYTTHASLQLHCADHRSVESISNSVMASLGQMCTPGTAPRTPHTAPPPPNPKSLAVAERAA